MYRNQQIKRRSNFSVAALGGALGFLGAFFISGFHFSETIVVNSKADLERFHSANPQWKLVPKGEKAVTYTEADAYRSIPSSSDQQFSLPECSQWKANHLSAVQVREQRMEDFDIPADNQGAIEWRPKLFLNDRTPTIPFSISLHQRLIHKAEN